MNVTDYYDTKSSGTECLSFTVCNRAEVRVATPLNQGYVERVEARDRLMGQKRMFTYAEGFVSKLPLVVDRFD